jgi:hypothetical protein
MAPQTEVQAAPRHHVPVLRKALAGVVLIAAAALALKLVIGFVIAIFWVVVAVVLAAAVLWALKTLLW